MKIFPKRAGIIAALAAGALATVGTAQARDRDYHGHRDRGDDVALAIGAGIIGLAIGAAIADRSDDHYYDRHYYAKRRYVRVHGHPGYYYYYDGHPNRYYRDRHYNRYYGKYYRERYDRHHYSRWERDHRRDDRYYNHDRRRGDHHRDDRRDRRHGWRD